MAQKIIIVAGVSSAGKSTFIKHVLLPQLSKQGINVKCDVEIKFAVNLLNDFDLGSKKICIIHYNLLLYFDSSPSLTEIDLMSEEVFCNLLKLPAGIEIYLCYAPQKDLINRICKRTHIEPDLTRSLAKYSPGTVLENLKKVDQRELLLEFGARLTHLAKNIQVVHSQGGRINIVKMDQLKK